MTCVPYFLIQRPLWRHYLQDTQVIMFFVDSNDRDRMSECKDELWTFLDEEDLKNVVILVMANKQDLPNAMSVEEVSRELGIENVKDRTIRKFYFTCR